MVTKKPKGLGRGLEALLGPKVEDKVEQAQAADAGLLAHEVCAQVAPTLRSGVLSGPSFAQEVARNQPTALVAASEHASVREALVAAFHSPSVRVYANEDIVGVEVGGAVKNVIAIGAGLSDGLGFGANARTALITRGLVELQRLGVALGADAKTFMGMAGLGDLVLTCTDNQSRNRRFGLALGAGKSIEQAMDEIGQVVEGYRNTKEVRALAERYGVEMPITEQIYQVLYCGKDAREAALTLLGRARKDEKSSH